MTVFYASPDYPLPAYADGVVYEPVSKKEYAALANQEAEKILSAIAQKAEAGGLECATVHTIAPAPWEAILAAAKKAKAGAIVMALVHHESAGGRQRPKSWPSTQKSTASASRRSRYASSSRVPASRRRAASPGVAR